MDHHSAQDWLQSVLPRYGSLMVMVESIISNLLREKGIDYLAITSRVKAESSVLEKIERKQYKNPPEQLTDLGGVRVIVFFESDLQRVAEVIEGAFVIDGDNSSDKIQQMSVNQTGYRSLHYVCDLGDERGALPEYKGLAGLKFEFQVRTVLQHAWAELAHDRNYKFSGKLPHDIERRLYLYAGMLELADKGLDELSRQMDTHIEKVQNDIKSGKLDAVIDSVSLVQFVGEWAERHNVSLKFMDFKSGFEDLINELNLFGVTTLAQLRALVPADYHEHILEETTIYGVVRDWMLIKDWRGFFERVPCKWVFEDGDDEPLWRYLSADDRREFCQTFEIIPKDPEYSLEGEL
ncbi:MULTISPECIES: GTP pyrophosphokinase [Pseudomonas]|uniref:GTP pyrophosphokinase n=1 Tax=Pseudomonas TaxID=286 RepID=UPI0022494188|nr:hypothetical protein [Pseudomonas sp. DCB_BG]MCX2706107.1 hypothetical protein [Pseudomonas sp. DCB_BG]